MPAPWLRTLRLLQRRRKSSLRVDSSPTRSCSVFVVRVAAGFGVQDRDAGVGGEVPVGVEVVGGVEVQEGEPDEVRHRVARRLVDGGVHGSAEVVGGEQVHPAVADDRRGGEGIEHPLQTRPGLPAFRGSAGPHAGDGAVGGVGEMEQVGPFGVVEPEGAGNRVEHGRRCTGDRAAFELGVVLDADPGQRSNLGPAQPGYPPCAVGRQAGFRRGDLGSPRDEELADLVTVVHKIRRYDAGTETWDALVVHPTTGHPTSATAGVDWDQFPHESDLSRSWPADAWCCDACPR